MQRDVSAKVCGLIKTKRLYESVREKEKGDLCPPCFLRVVSGLDCLLND